MSYVSRLLENYQSFVKLPWQSGLASSQRVWFLVYHPSEERRVRAHAKNFEASTLEAQHKWQSIDITDETSEWLSKHESSSEFFKHPDAIVGAEEDLRDHIASIIQVALEKPGIDDNTVLAVIGTGSLFGFGSVSSAVSSIESSIKGRLLVFFPGEYDDNQYRFMDAREGFNYMAVPITSSPRMQI